MAPDLYIGTPNGIRIVVEGDSGEIKTQIMVGSKAKFSDITRLRTAVKQVDAMLDDQLGFFSMDAIDSICEKGLFKKGNKRLG